MGRSLLVAVLLLGCGRGELSVSTTTLDFGVVTVGGSRSLTVEVENKGSAAFDLGGLGLDDAAFATAFERATVPPGAKQTVQIGFAPTAAGNHETTATLHSSIGDVALTLKGTGIQPACEVPALHDFGKVSVGENLTWSFFLSNTGPTDVTASVGAITNNNGDKDAFSFAPESDQGELVIEAGSSRTVAIRFAPHDVKSFLALLKVRPAQGCPEATVELEGTGIAEALTCFPSPLDFGDVRPGTTRRKQLTVSNASQSAVTLTNLAARVGTLASPELQLVGATTVTVPPEGQTTLELDFTATLLGQRLATLTADTSLASQALLSCALRATVVDRHLEVSPAGPIDFGRVPYFVNAAQPFSVTRVITLRNTGGTPLALGTPAWTVTPLNSNSLSTEICVGELNGTCSNAPPASYNPAFGLGPNQSLAIPVRITPAAANKQMSWQISFTSNDPDHPVVSVIVNAQSVIVPECNYSLTPGALTFGRIAPPETRDLAFSIANNGSNASEGCLVTELSISDPRFTLVDPPALPFNLAAGASIPILVRASPRGLVLPTAQTVAAGVQVGISSSTAPTVNVPITATLALRCLTLQPATVDFGTVAPGCASERRTVSLYNACSTPVLFTSLSTLPNATELQNDFAFDGGSIPALSPMPLTFGVTYRPSSDAGTDFGALAFQVVQNGVPLSELLTLRGHASASSLNTDVFTVPLAPKTDVLMLISDAPSMADDQTMASANLARFAQQLGDAGLDLHLGVAKTDVGAGAAVGQLLGFPVALPSAAGLAQRANVGVMGSGFNSVADVAVRALTAPLADVQNAGFLRADAALAIIAITDSSDVSLVPSAITASLISAVKSNSRVGFHVVGPFGVGGSGCAYGNAAGGASYVSLTDAFRGARHDLCDSDWSPLFDQAIRETRGDGRFPLTAEPDLTGGRVIDVEVDGVAVAPARFGFDALTRAVIFDATALPAPGATVRISYSVVCR